MNATIFFKKLGYSPKVDTLLTLAFNRIIIDLYDFEKQVFRQFGIKENADVSLNDVLKEHYDNEIIEKIKYYTGC